MTMARVPVLLLSGPVGAGKSSVGAAASRLLREAGVPHALIDLAVVGDCWPAPADDPWNERVAHRNLARMWSNFRAAGAGRLILCRVLEARSLLGQVAAALLRRREAGDPTWYLEAAAHLAASMERDPSRTTSWTTAAGRSARSPPRSCAWPAGRPEAPVQPSGSPPGPLPNGNSRMTW